MCSAFLSPVTLPLHPTTHIINRSTLRPVATSQPSSRPPPASIPASSKPLVTLKPFENNTFLLQSEDTTLLIDPWLEDDLVFLSPGFFRGRKPPPRSPELDYTALDLTTVDAIILTQGLADHAHPPTLAVLPRNIPVVAPQSAVSLLRSLGYENIIEVTYGDSVRPVPNAAVTVTTLRGSVVGPPWSDAQHAYVFKFGDDESCMIYHEPHGNHDVERLRRYEGRLDAVIAPIVSTTIPILGDYALVNGIPQAMELCRLTRPKRCVTFDNSKGEQTGFLTDFLKMDGGVDRFVDEVRKDGSLGDMKIVRTDVAKKAVVIGGETSRNTENALKTVALQDQKSDFVETI